MESLALLASIIVLPAMFGGPLALLLTFWRKRDIGKSRKLLVRIMAILGLATGIFLLIGDISRGATIIGVIGVSTSALALWRTR